MASIDDILGQLKLPERVYNLGPRADLQAEWEQAEQDLAKAEAQARDSLAGLGAAGKATAKRIQELEEQMAEHTVAVKLRALPHKAWSDLLAKHPPREDHAGDGAFNSDTFGVGLLAACAVDPVMTDEQAGALVDRLSSGQWNELFSVLWGLNRSGVEVPKSRRASEALRKSQTK
jgi:hypothetical protein